MKKSILFLGLLGGLTSCDKLFDDTPKCDDKEVVALVEAIGVEQLLENEENEYYSRVLFAHEYFYEDYKKFYENNSIPDEIDEDWEKKWTDFNEEKLNEIKEKLKFIENGNNITYNSKIKNAVIKTYGLKVSNIRPVVSDKESKKCECEANITYNPIDPNTSYERIKAFSKDRVYFPQKEETKDIYYTAQKNTDGQIYVEVLGFDFDFN